jgi:inosine/xanthosine triphosphate pyrophosphatase family protein
MLVPSMGKTAAELTSDEKNAISHRGNAMRKLKPLLIAYLDSVQRIEE